MSLRTKAVIVSVLMMSAFMVALYLAASRVLTTGFERVERDAVARSVQTLEGHMPFEVAVVAEKLGALASLEDLAAFAEEPDPAFAARHLTGDAVRRAELSFAVVFGPDGQAIHAAVAPTFGVEPAEIETAWREATGDASADRGLLRVGAFTAIVAATPLVPPGETESAGSMLVGRRIDAVMVQQIESLTHLEIDVRPYDGAQLPPAFREARRAIEAGTSRPIEALDESTIVGFTRLRDVAGAPALLVRVTTPRPIAAQARESRTTLLAATGGVGVAMVLLVVWLLQRGLLHRFLRMSGSVRAIAAEQDTSLRVAVRGEDELAQLGRDVNGMLTSLERAQSALRESEARYALVASGANDGMWDWDVRRGEVWYSARFMSMVGGSAREAWGDLDVWRCRIHPDDRPRFETHLTRFWRGEVPVFEDEHRVRLADGSWRWVLARGAATWREGAPVRIAGSLTDMTERGVFDPSTGLANHVLLASHLRQVITRVRRGSSEGAAVVALKSDRFKAANDGLGPEAGEHLITESAGRISEGLRAGDMLARTERDEFVAVLEDVASAEEVLAVVERIQERMARPFGVEGATVHLPVTAGVVSDVAAYDTVNALVNDAVIARDQARASGRTFAWFDGVMHERLVHRQRTESELREGIAAGELILHYQPIVELASGRLHGFEALVRWAHPTRGLLSPAAFVDLAEETGLIKPLGTWVLQEASHAARTLSRAGGANADAVVHVNLSAKQLKEPGLVDQVEEAVRAAGVDAARLELEVTETVMMAHADAAAAVLARLRALGVRLAIDDFGTGYSSLGYLHDLPMDTLKIDRSFVFRMPEDVRSRKIVRTVAQLGAALGMQVVAEGIETEAHLRAVREAGVRYGQGYYFARPAALDEAMRWTSPVVSP